MTVYVDDPDFRLLCGDALEQLRTLPDGSVHCALTSPPFFGLRDYGTGSWEGGDAECDHTKPRTSSPLNSGFNERWGNSPGEKKQENERGEVYRDTCGKCGARRVDQQIGLEATPDEWVARLVAVFREVRRVLRDDGTLWVECGDSYSAGTQGRNDADRRNGHGSFFDGEHKPRQSSGEVATRKPPEGYKPKDLLGQPWLLAFALRADGWYQRQAIIETQIWICPCGCGHEMVLYQSIPGHFIWHKPNAMPESVRDRCTTAHSYVFLFSKRPRYFFDAEAIAEPLDRPELDGARRNVGKLSARNGSEFGVRAHEGRDGGYSAIPGARNARSVWQIPTSGFSEAHFATWPPALVERIIRAGTSERGVCPECGAPWVRETDVSYEKSPVHGEGSTVRKRNEGQDVNGWAGEAMPRVAKVTQTLGWKPSCDCKEIHEMPRDVVLSPITATVPATVLDPFMGSGTTALVARNLGRRSIGIELNRSYCQMAARRLSQLSLLAEAQA